jgi:hypothetical protein
MSACVWIHADHGRTCERWRAVRRRPGWRASTSPMTSCLRRAGHGIAVLNPRSESTASRRRCRSSPRFCAPIDRPSTAPTTPWNRAAASRSPFSGRYRYSSVQQVSSVPSRWQPASPTPGMPGQRRRSFDAQAKILEAVCTALGRDSGEVRRLTGQVVLTVMVRAPTYESERAIYLPDDVEHLRSPLAHSRRQDSLCCLRDGGDRSCHASATHRGVLALRKRVDLVVPGEVPHAQRALTVIVGIVQLTCTNTLASVDRRWQRLVVLPHICHILASGHGYSTVTSSPFVHTPRAEGRVAHPCRSPRTTSSLRAASTGELNLLVRVDHGWEHRHPQRILQCGGPPGDTRRTPCRTDSDRSVRRISDEMPESALPDRPASRSGAPCRLRR